MRGFIDQIAPALMIAAVFLCANVAIAYFSARLEFLLFSVVFTHAYFIMFFTARLLRKQTAGRVGARASAPFRSLSGACLLAAPIGLIGFLDANTSSFCAHGAINSVPWIWIGWLSLAVFVLPTRIVALIEGVKVKIVGLAPRLIVCGLWFFAIYLLGAPFQLRSELSAPGELFGLFEGGLITWPWLGAFFLVASLSAAAISAAAAKD